MAKSFKNVNTSELFISSATQPVKEEMQAGELVIPKGYVLKPESKTTRMQILVTPYTKGLLKERAEATGLSMNEIINLAIEEYFKTI